MCDRFQLPDPESELSDEEKYELHLLKEQEYAEFKEDERVFEGENVNT
jgi:hypothetical protein